MTSGREQQDGASGSVETPPVLAAGFAAVLRDGTHAIHREAERSGYIADLLHGRGTRWGYALYLANLLPIYEIMEDCLSGSVSAPVLQAFADPHLFRAGRLRADIAALRKGDEAGLAILPETRAYAATVEAAADGIGLAAHAYARYLGDLSGGQILKTLLARTLDLRSDQLGFYDFPGVDVPACKTALRDALDQVPTGSEAANLILREADAAFRHTIIVSCAVSAALGA